MECKVNCPYSNQEGLQELPCEFVAHPHDRDIMFCKSCGGNEYNVRDIANPKANYKKSDQPFWAILGVLMLLLIGMLRIASEPTAYDSEVPSSPPLEESRL